MPSEGRGILSPVRLPVPPLQQVLSLSEFTAGPASHTAVVSMVGSAREFGEVADWWGIERFALPGVFDAEYPPLRQCCRPTRCSEGLLTRHDSGWAGAAKI